MKKIIFFTFIALSFFGTMFSHSKKDKVIVDSNMTFEEAIKGTKAPKYLLDSLCLIEVQYWSFDGKLHQGQIVCANAVQQDIIDIFNLMLDFKFPVGKVIPIVQYNWDDELSMDDNNTSCFNYRNIAGTTRLSRHSFGRAIDINPYYNPVVYKDGKTDPQKAKYDPSRKGTFFQNHPIVIEFKKRGWQWGGEFKEYKDNHHFDKPNKE
jgi:peptidoglycan LD-endopeptidase CwlK